MDTMSARALTFFAYLFLFFLTCFITRICVFGFYNIELVFLVGWVLAGGFFVGSLLAYFRLNCFRATPSEHALEIESAQSASVPFAILAEDEAPDAMILNEECQKKIRELKKKIFALSAEELIQGALYILNDLADQIIEGHRVIVVSEVANLDEKGLPDIERYKVKEIILGSLQRFRDDEDEDGTEPCFRIVPKSKEKMN
jgi:hypothetical protein